jgi:hypothetical protein
MVPPISSSNNLSESPVISTWSHHAMSKKTAKSLSTGGDGLQILKPSIVVLNWLQWIDPPIGVNVNGVNYKVRIMFVSNLQGTTKTLPFAELFTWNPANPPVGLWQYYLTSVVDPNQSGSKYYETMIVSQTSGPGLTIKSRVFVTPQSTPFAGPTLGTATPDNPASILQVNGVVDSTNTTRSVSYQHFTTNGAPTDLYLQQPS